MTAEPVYVLMMKARQDRLGVLGIGPLTDEPLLVFDDEAAATETLGYLTEMPLAGRATFRIAKALRPILGAEPTADCAVRAITFADVLASAFAETDR